MRQEPILHVVLVEPEIPPNTGNIARTCGVVGARLHLVHPLGFRTDDRTVKRAGVDYWHLVDIEEHACWDAFLTAYPNGRRFFFTGKAERRYTDVSFAKGDFLIFGKESTGLPGWMLERYHDDCVRIPMRGPVRSLNLSNAAAVGVYEALRQLRFPEMQ